MINVSNDHTQMARAFLIAFIWALLAGACFQLLVLPSLDHLHAGNGLMKGGDWVSFHAEAVKLMGQINASGWGEWYLRPGGNSPGGITAAAYTVTGISQPWVLLPVNAALFGFSALCLFCIFRQFADGRTATLAVLPFVFYPSGLVIYGQIHKDVYSIAGFFAIVLVCTCMFNRPRLGLKESVMFAALVLLGAALVWLVRPYLLKPIFLLAFCAFAFAAAIWHKRNFNWWATALVLLGLIFAVDYLHGRFKPPAEPSSLADISITQPAPAQASASAPAPVGDGVDLAVTATPVLESAANAQVAPDKGAIAVMLDKVVSQIGSTRRVFATLIPDAGSNIDTHVEFHTFYDIVSYLPRVVQVGIFAPFPQHWVAQGAAPGGSTMRAISGIEMAVAYLIFVGAFGLIALKRAGVLVPILMALGIIVIIALVMVNMGTLYRMRYGAFHLLTGFGIIGWACLWRIRRAASNHD